MKKHSLILVAVFGFMTLFWMNVTADSSAVPDLSWYEGQSSPYVIDSMEDMLGLRYLVNNDIDNFGGKVINLQSDIDFANTVWKIGIGYTNNLTQEQHAFCGTFNGNEHIFENFNYNSNEENDIDSSLEIPDISKYITHGLFGIVGANGSVNDLAVVNSSVEAGDSNKAVNNLNAGIIVGINKGSIKSCYINNVKFKGGYYLGQTWCLQYYGGVVGTNYGSVFNCFANGLDFRELLAKINATRKGGIVATNAGTVSCCYSANLEYDSGNGFYKYDENGVGIPGMMTRIMYIYDPIVAEVLDGATVTDVSSQDSFFSVNGKSTKRAYDDFLPWSAEIENTFFDNISFDAISLAKISSVNPLKGNKSIYIEFTKDIDKSVLTPDAFDVRHNNDSVAVIGVNAGELGCTIEFDKEMQWGEQYSVSINEITDEFGRSSSIKDSLYMSLDKMNADSFEIYQNYLSADQSIVSAIPSDNTEITAVIKGLKNNSAVEYNSAVLSIAFINEGRLICGKVRSVSIPAYADITDDILIAFKIPQGAYSGESILQAVLYSGYTNVVPLIKSSTVIWK